ncbi:MAG: hypothetical protein ACPL3C_07050, partial [Pyrobaculum sp.]
AAVLPTAKPHPANLKVSLSIGRAAGPRSPARCPTPTRLLNTPGSYGEVSRHRESSVCLLNDGPEAPHIHPSAAGCICAITQPWTRATLLSASTGSATDNKPLWRSSNKSPLLRLGIS